jgi:hypothetical protein
MGRFMVVLGDRVLSRLVPKVDASGCCPPDCYHRGSRTCCTRCDCTVFCS